MSDREQTMRADCDSCAPQCPTCGKPPHDPCDATTWGPDGACECPRTVTHAEARRHVNQIQCDAERGCGSYTAHAALLRYIDEQEERQGDESLARLKLEGDLERVQADYARYIDEQEARADDRAELEADRQEYIVRATVAEANCATLAATLASAKAKHKEDAAQIVSLLHERDEVRAAIAEAHEAWGVDAAVAAMRRLRHGLGTGESDTCHDDTVTEALRAVERLVEQRDEARADMERAKGLSARLATLLGRVSTALDDLAPLDEDVDADTPLDERVRFALLGAEAARIDASTTALERDRWSAAADRDARDAATARRDEQHHRATADRVIAWVRERHGEAGVDEALGVTR